MSLVLATRPAGETGHAAVHDDGAIAARMLSDHYREVILV
jgi:hypothetical protein